MALLSMTGAEDEEAFLEQSQVRTEPVGFKWRRPILLASALAAGAACAVFSGRPGLAAAEIRSDVQVESKNEKKPAPHDTKPADDDRSDCATPDDDCSEQKCCADSSMKCFRKNADLAQCMTDCKPGLHKGVDWNCAILETTTPPPPTTPPPCASAPGEDCTKSKCCADPDKHCWEKNEWYATCHETCKVGVHKDDSDKKPWSCKQLLPWMEDTTTTVVPKESTPPPAVITPPVNCDAPPMAVLPPFTGCSASPSFIKILTYNLFWWNLYGVRKGNGNSAGLLVRSTNTPLPWDLMAFQECEDGDRIVGGAGLLDSHQVFSFAPMTKTSAVCFSYRKAAFTLLDHGQQYLAEDSQEQYFGKRVVQWMRLMHHASGKPIFFMNHHGPLPVNSGGKCGGAITARKIVNAIATNMQPGDAIFLVGDFNAEPSSATLNGISSVLHDFVPAGIDNMFSNLPLPSLVRNMDIGSGGSDHEARLAVFQIGR